VIIYALTPGNETSGLGNVSYVCLKFAGPVLFVSVTSANAVDQELAYAAA